MHEFLVKYAHKLAQQSTKICKNVLKYELNMQNQLFSIKCHFTQIIFSVTFKILYSCDTTILQSPL